MSCNHVDFNPEGSLEVGGVITSEDLRQTRSNDWAYIAEGGAHIVFRYQGTKAKFAGQVLRLAKLIKKKRPDESIHQLWEKKLLSQLLPPTLLVQTVPVILDISWTRHLLAEMDQLRPANRTNSNEYLFSAIDFSRPGKLMRDLTTGSLVPDEKVLAVELKPKWGFLPSGANVVPSEAIPIKTRVCRYCLHQHFRGHDVDSWPRYCPLDLFSGEETRIRSAFEGLWKAWRVSNGECNNLRVFVDGIRVLPSNAHLIPSSSGEDITQDTFDFIAPLLTSSGALQQILTLQATLDPTDISDLASRYAAAHPDTGLFATSFVPIPSQTQLSTFVGVYKSDPSAGKNSDTWSLDQRMVAYGLSAIFKDCSLIIRAVLSAKPDGPCDLNVDKSEVKIIDLDLKPLSSLEHWATLDEQLWRHWANTKGSPPYVFPPCGHRAASSA